MDAGRCIVNKISHLPSPFDTVQNRSDHRLLFVYLTSQSVSGKFTAVYLFTFMLFLLCLCVYASRSSLMKITDAFMTCIWTHVT